MMVDKKVVKNKQQVLLRPKGEVTVFVGDEAIKSYNIQTNLYRTYHANWLVNDYPIDLETGSPSVGRYAIAIGDGTATAYASDTSLGNEIMRKDITARYVARTYTARLITTFTAAEPPVPPGSSSVSFTEFGLFDEGSVAWDNGGFETWSGSPSSPNGWHKLGGAWAPGTATNHIYGSSGTSLSIAGSAYLYYDIPFDSAWCGQSITFRMALQDNWDCPNHSQLYIYDGVSTTYGSPHPGGAGTPWALCSVTKTLDGTANTMRVGVWNREDACYCDWGNVVVDGNLLARALISLNKTSSKPMSVQWDIYLEEVEEGEAMGYKAFAYEEVAAGTTSAGSLTQATYAPTGQSHAERMRITIKGNPIGYRYDSGTPSSGTPGHYLGTAYDVDPLVITDYTNISQFRFIGIGGSSTVCATYER